MGREPQIERVRRADARPGEAEIEPRLAAQPRQEPGRADVREEPDPGLRHREQGALRHDAMRAVDRDADSAAHHHAVDQRDIGLGIAENQRVEPVLLGVEDHGEAALRIRPPVVEQADVAARTERHAAILPRGAPDDHGGDRRIAGPFPELRVESDDHGLGQRVERAWPVQRDAADPADPLQNDLVAHARPAPVVRRHPTGKAARGE